MKDELKKRIMKRVYAIWFFRKIAPAMFLYMPFLAVVALWQTAREFFVVRIIDNFLLAFHTGGVGGVLGLTFSALVNTPVLSTLIILTSLGTFFVLFRRLSKNMREAQLMRSY